MSPILICFSSFESERSHDLEHGSSVETIVRMNEDDIDAGVVLFFSVTVILQHGAPFVSAL